MARNRGESHPTGEGKGDALRLLPAGLGLAWAAIQVVLTLTVLQTDPVGLECTHHLPKDSLATATGGVSLSAIAASVFALVRRPRAARLALAVECIMTIAWIALGGFGALDCAYDV